MTLCAPWRILVGAWPVTLPLSFQFSSTCGDCSHLTKVGPQRSKVDIEYSHEAQVAAACMFNGKLSYEDKDGDDWTEIACKEAQGTFKADLQRSEI